MRSTTCDTKVAWLLARQALEQKILTRLASSLAITLALVSIVGCSLDSNETVGTPTLESLLSVDLTHVDEEVRQFLHRKQEAAQKAPQSADAVGELAMALEMNGFVDTALHGYQLASSKDAPNPRWPYYEALIHASYGDYDLALAAMNQSIELDSTYGASWMWKASWHLELNELEAAVDAYESAIQSGINRAGNIGIVQVLMRKGENQQALNLLDELETVISHPQIKHLKLKVQTRLGLSTAPSAATSLESGQIGWPDPRSAEKRLFEVSLSAELSKFRGLIEHEDGLAEASRLIDELYSKYPNSERVVLAKVHSLRLQDDIAGLHSLLNEAHRLWPEQIAFTLGLAELAISADEPEGAKELLDLVLQQDTANAWALYQRGLLHAKEGAFDAAIHALTRALEASETADAHYYLGHAHAENQDWVTAHCHMRRALELAPNFGGAERDLKLLAERVGTAESLRVYVPETNLCMLESES